MGQLSKVEEGRLTEIPAGARLDLVEEQVLFIFRRNDTRAVPPNRENTICPHGGGQGKRPAPYNSLRFS
jgi:hypothetical protein